MAAVWTRGLALLVAASVIACSSDPSTSPSPSTDDPANAKLVVTDIQNFWSAYDEYHRTGSTSAFQSLYLDRASPGLQDFIRSRSLTASNVAATASAFPRYFDGIRPVSAQLESGAVSQQVRAGYSRLKDLYPSAVFPDVTFLIGRFSTGGTTSNGRILVGTEFYLASPGVPVDELPTFQRTNVHPLDFLPVLVAHEHTHILQQRAHGIFGHSTLLEQSLLEGSADFIGELVSGGNINAKAHEWAMPREHMLWTEFQAAMSGTDVTAWLYNQGSATSERPGDLGYFVGYRIAQAYYQKASDKRQAVKDIVEIGDAPVFLRTSGYSP